jgi:TIR domain
MAFLTRAQALGASPAARSVNLAENELRKSASRPQTTNFDIFLSHAHEDARIIAGVKALLEGEGLTVYVDWLADPQLDRGRVNTETARLLRLRMDHSGYLLYASSSASSNSKWMPWELGYFDGKRGGSIGILPIVAQAGEGFRGLEYLGLYPLVELVSFQRGGTRFGHYTSDTTARSLRSMARS